MVLSKNCEHEKIVEWTKGEAPITFRKQNKKDPVSIFLSNFVDSRPKKKILAL